MSGAAEPLRIPSAAAERWHHGGFRRAGERSQRNASLWSADGVGFSHTSAQGSCDSHVGCGTVRLLPAGEVGKWALAGTEGLKGPSPSL